MTRPETASLRARIVATAEKHGIDPDYMLTHREQSTLRSLAFLAAMAELPVHEVARRMGVESRP